jgi:transposase
MNNQVKYSMILYGAGWHTAGFLMIPKNMRLVPLPPYAPELNPMEHIWDDLREKSFHNCVFETMNALEDHLEVTLQTMECNKERVKSIVS